MRYQDEPVYIPVACQEPSNLYTDGDGVIALKIDLVYQPVWFSSDSYAGIGDAVIGLKNGFPTTVAGILRNGTFVHQVGDVVSTMLLTRYSDTVYAKLLEGESEFNISTYQERSDGNMWWDFAGSTTYQPNSTQFSSAVWSEYFTDLPTSTKDPTQAGEMHPIE